MINLPPIQEEIRPHGIRVLKFYEEWWIYPNGKVFFKKKCPIGEGSVVPKKKKEQKELNLEGNQGEESI